MKEGPRPSPALGLGGLAAAGAIAGHHLTYEWASSSGHHSERLLGAAGHRHVALCAAVALGLVMTGLVSFLRARLHASGRGERPVRLSLRLAPRLIPAQMGAFVALEAAERALLADGGVGGLLGEVHVQLGVVIQGMVALGAAGVLAIVASVVDRVARRARRPRPSRARSVRAILPRVQVAPIPAVAVRAGTISFRGPPNARHLRR